MTESHFIRGRMEPKWLRASEFRCNSATRRTTPKGPVFAVELDMDDYLTLRGGIQAATFGNCLIVEPHRQGYSIPRTFASKSIRLYGVRVYKKQISLNGTMEE